jgi:aminoglycoside phosphotransferase (APT) family kinase protein
VSGKVSGLDLAALTSWWRTYLLEPLDGPLEAQLITGGKSNLTYRVSDGTRTWVLRRPPLGHVLPTAHDMAREHRVMTALAPTDVPVPQTFGICQDESILGAQFYVMAHVAGTPYRTAAQLSPLGPARARRISEGLVDALVALHEVDQKAVGLADFGRPDGFLQRQVRRWKKQLDASHNRELPAAIELHHRLEAQAEAADRVGRETTGIVHGDYRLDNVLTSWDRTQGDHPAAVLDWEMATLGNTLTDVALLVVYARIANLLPGVVADASTTPGFLTEREMLHRYSCARGRDMPELGFHLALASFKLVAILEGIHYRYLKGQTVGDGFDRVGEAAEPLLQAGLASLSST